ncbi:MAG TPA: glycosyltransferase family 39 protein, partial [Planctomycetota bacterium]|nr:glycosyltransferase family 39 protein [Planctomycetota bacterium]
MTRQKAFLIAVLAVAAGLRIYSLGSKSLWLDEIVSVQHVRGSFGQMLGEVAQHDAHPPLYYIFQYAARIFGRSEFAVRLPSALCGIALVYVVYRLGRSLLNEGAGLAAAGLTAISGFAIFYSQEARPYALAMLMAATSAWMLTELLKRDDVRTPHAKWWWIAYTLVGAAMLHTFYYLAFALLAEAAAVLATRRRRAFIARWLISRAVAAAAFAPYMIVVLNRIAGLPPAPGQSRWEVLASVPGAYVQMLTGIDPAMLHGSAPVMIFLYLAGIIPVVIGLVLLWRARTNIRAFAVLAASVAVPAAALLVLPWRLQIFEAKHLAFAAPALLIIAAWLPASVRRPIAWLPVGLIVILNAYSLAVYCSPQFQKERWPEACRIVHENVQPGDAILFNPYYLAYGFVYYYEHHGELIRIEDISALPPENRPKRLWLIEDRGSNVAPADPAVDAAV